MKLPMHAAGAVRALGLAVVLGTTPFAPVQAAQAPLAQKVIFFAADGMRQDLVEGYTARRLLPAMGSVLKAGVAASDGGLLTQAPSNTGGGWYSLATGAWPGVHGSTNNTFHINGQPFANSTSAFSTAALHAPLDTLSGGWRMRAALRHLGQVTA